VALVLAVYAVTVMLYTVWLPREKLIIAGVNQPAVGYVLADNPDGWMCMLALSRYLGLATSPLLAREVDRVMAEGAYETTVFFIRNQGFVRPTPARQISFQDSLAFERLHEQVYRELGFQLVEVPAGPLADRVALIKQTVRQH